MRQTKYLYILLLSLFLNIGVFKNTYSQNDCTYPIQLCFTTDSIVSFPAATNAGNASTGPNYGCLATTPNPTWFYFQTGSSVTNITQFYYSSNPSVDIDAIIWGPLTSSVSMCSQITSSTSIINCSYSANATETLTIPNTVANSYYLMMITNYSALPNNSHVACLQGRSNVVCPTSAPIANFAFTPTVGCVSNPIQINDLSSPLGGILAWNYQTSDGQFSSLQNPSFTFTTTGVYSVSLTVSSSAGNSTVTTKTIQINSSCSTPTVAVSQQSATCGTPNSCNGQITLTATGSPPFTYSWTPSVSTGSVATGLCPGTYTCYVTNSLGGTTTKTINLTGNPAITVTLSASKTSLCQGDSTLITSVVSGGVGGAYTYSWSTSATTNVITTYPSPPSSTYSLAVKDMTNCSLMSSITITVDIFPNISQTISSPSICAGSICTVTLSGASNFTTNPGGISVNVFSVSPTSSTNYTVIGANSACKDTANFMINVLPTPSVSSVVSDTTLCLGFTSTVTLSGATNYTTIPGNINSSSYTVSPIFNTTYTVVGTNGNCSNTKTFHIQVLPLPVINASASSTLVCPGQTVSLSASGTIINFLWQPNNLIGQNQNVVINAPITYTVYGQDINGCVNLDIIQIDTGGVLFVTPVVTPSIVCIGDSSILTVIGGNVPSWAPTNQLTVFPLSDTTIVMTVNSNNGCSGPISFHLKINPECEVVVYNGFTPNGDGVNDFWFIDNIEKYHNNKVSVFNRWGNKIYDTKSYNNSSNYWDGKINSVTVSSGTYFYVISSEDNKVIRKGWIEITN